MTVYLVQEPLRIEDGVPVPRIGYHTLMPFGELKMVFAWGEIRDTDDLTNPARMGTLMDHLYRSLATFSDADYLVPLGNPALIAMATMVAGDINDGRVAVLDWMRDQRRYRVWNINLNQPSPEYTPP